MDVINEQNCFHEIFFQSKWSFMCHFSAYLDKHFLFKRERFHENQIYNVLFDEIFCEFNFAQGVLGLRKVS